MAKREFIDRDELIIFVMDSEIDHLQTNEGIELCQAISEFPVFPEQDIVKPYLDKLRKELQTEAMEHSGTGEEVIQAYVDGLHEAIKRIDNLLSEQGDTE